MVYLAFWEGEDEWKPFGVAATLEIARALCASDTKQPLVWKEDPDEERAGAIRLLRTCSRPRAAASCQRSPRRSRPKCPSTPASCPAKYFSISGAATSATTIDSATSGSLARLRARSLELTDQGLAEMARVPQPDPPRKFKRFMVFGLDEFYPAGGLGDVVDSFDTIEEARARTKQEDHAIFEILDRETGEEVET